MVVPARAKMTFAEYQAMEETNQLAELIYGEKPSWNDPVKYSFAYGGKDGVPYPVNRKAMDESIHILRKTVQATKLGDKEKTRALQRLRVFVPPDAQTS